MSILNTHIRRAQDALKSARILLEVQDHVGAANRAYYAVFYAARAAVAHFTTIEPTKIKTHHGLRRLFELHVVKPGLISREIARSFNDVEETRIAADYEEQALHRPEVEAAIQDAESFVKACELMIGNKTP
jgi:uncharacterized protein (UPF0332 family)